MPTIRLPNNWLPRPYQLPSWKAWERGCKRLLLIWHRRAGKDDMALNITAVAAHQRVANYWHCLPMYEQARKAIWEAINPHTGKRRIDEAFPLELRKRTDNGSMTIEFKSGSIWKVVGSDNPNSLVGAPPAGIVFSEWALANPSAWAYLAPILAENGGWAIFITTPRGRNHVKSMLDMARKSEAWFSEVLTPDDTGFPLALIEEQRSEYHGIFGEDAGDALIDQEYWCSFEAAILGAYFGREMLNAEREKRIGKVEWEPDLPVHTVWDIGVGDSTSIWFYQQHMNQIRVIDYYEASGYAVPHYVDLLNEKPYSYGTDWLPHDAKVREWTNAQPDGTAKTRVQTLIELGRNPRVVPLASLDDSINAARRLIPHSVFDETKCARGLECLRQYRREWDDDNKVFRKTPLHDWSSHGASAWRYLAMAVEPIVVKKPKPAPEARLLQDITFDEMIKRQERREQMV
jgi:phage terminase large subunit